jgi:transcriptional regulator with XRE-family HTH domain
VGTDIVARNRRLQTEWYGEPLGDRMRKLLDALELTQAGLGQALGLSAPMLSQLISGHRAKISNPAVLSRLLAIEELVADPAFASLPARELRERLSRIRTDQQSTVTTVTQQSPAAVPQVPTPTTTDAVPTIQILLRAIATAAEIESAATLLDADFPDLAAFLRTYGNGRTAEAREHLRRSLTA